MACNQLSRRVDLHVNARLPDVLLCVRALILSTCELTHPNILRFVYFSLHQSASVQPNDFLLLKPIVKTGQKYPPLPLISPPNPTPKPPHPSSEFQEWFTSTAYFFYVNWRSKCWYFCQNLFVIFTIDSVCLCMHLCLFLCVLMYVSVSMYLCICVSLCVCLCVSVFLCMSLCFFVCVFMYLCFCVCLSACQYALVCL